MRVGRSIFAYAVGVAVFTLGNFCWYSGIAYHFYHTELQHLLATASDVGATTALYLLYALGIWIFAARPGIQSGTIKKAFVLGALFGFFVYATYDLTNQATLQNWPYLITFVDVIWGTLLTALISGVQYIAYRFK